LAYVALKIVCAVAHKIVDATAVLANACDKIAPYHLRKDEMNNHDEEQVWRRPPVAPDFSLEGRVALITGAGRGIGRGIAYALASAGCAIALQDIDLKSRKKPWPNWPKPVPGL
jgi:FlaA1/EpsC-like NDP-sugar epimerase